MQKDYETFVEKLEIGIYEATGIPRENISKNTQKLLVQ